METAEEQRERLQRRFAASWGEDENGDVEPFVRGLHKDCVFTVEPHRGAACVVVEFSQDSVPGVRFRHRFPPPEYWEDEDYGDVHFMEMVMTGKLRRLNTEGSSRPVWTDFGYDA